MSRKSPFTDEWRKCLEEHYKHVIRTEDKVTQPSLEDVLHQVGFADDDLSDLRIKATMHVDDMPDGYKPNIPSLAAHAAECTCAQCSAQAAAIEAAIEANHDADGQPLPPDYEPEGEAGEVYSVPSPVMLWAEEEWIGQDVSEAPNDATDTKSGKKKSSKKSKKSEDKQAEAPKQKALF